MSFNPEDFWIRVNFVTVKKTKKITIWCREKLREKSQTHRWGAAASHGDTSLPDSLFHFFRLISRRRTFCGFGPELLQIFVCRRAAPSPEFVLWIRRAALLPLSHSVKGLTWYIMSCTCKWESIFKTLTKAENKRTQNKLKIPA